MDTPRPRSAWAVIAKIARTPNCWELQPAGALLLSGAARPLRFVCTGGLAGLTQLSLLTLLTRQGWRPMEANALAFLLAAQVNFALSYLFTWRDRLGTHALWQHWAMFHGSIAGMAVVNMLVFMAARAALPTLLASAAGIGVAATGNFVVGDRVVFRARDAALPVMIGHDQTEPESAGIAACARSGDGR